MSVNPSKYVAMKCMAHIWHIWSLSSNLYAPWLHLWLVNVIESVDLMHTHFTRCLFLSTSVNNIYIIVAKCHPIWNDYKIKLPFKWLPTAAGIFLLVALLTKCGTIKYTIVHKYHFVVVVLASTIANSPLCPFSLSLSFTFTFICAKLAFFVGVVAFVNRNIRVMSNNRGKITEHFSSSV